MTAKHHFLGASVSRASDDSGGRFEKQESLAFA